MKECHFDEKALPSAGIIPFLQTFYCTFSNLCHSTAKFDGKPKFNSSNLFSVVSELESVLKSSIHPNEIRNFRIVEKDLYHVEEFLSKIYDNSSGINDNVNFVNLVSESPNEVFKKHNLSFSFDINDVLNSTQISIFHLIEILLSNNTLTATNFFCDQKLFYSVVNSQHKLQLNEILDSLCRLPKSHRSSLVLDILNLVTLKSATKELSNLMEANTGKTLNVEAWEIVLSSMRHITNQVSDLEDVQQSMKLSHSTFSKMILSLHSNSEVFVNNMLCGRGETYFNETEKVVDGLARLDEMGRKFHFIVVNNEPSDDNDNATSQACKQLFASFEKDQFTRLVWKQVKPFVRGKILYTPNTLAARKIMSQVNDSFSIINDILALMDQWLNNISPNFRSQFINNSETVQFWQNITDRKHIQENPAVNLFWKIALRTLKDGNWFAESDEDAFIDRLHAYFMNDPSKKWLDGVQKIDSIVKSVNRLIQCFDMNKLEPLETEEEAVAKGIELIAIDRLWAVIVFENLNSSDSENDSVLPPHVRYKIRMDADKIDSTKRVQDRIPTMGSRSNPMIDLKYFTSGFVYLQDLIEHAIIKEQTGVEGLPGFWVQQFPYPCYIYDQFILAISRTFPMFMVLAWVYTSAMIVKTVVHEKERRLKEIMKVMGLGNGVHWLGWFINSFVIMMSTVIFLTLILKYGYILQASDPTIIFIFLTLYMAATITKSFLISTLFSTANVAAATGGICFFILYLPYPFIVIWEEELVGYEKVLGSLLSNVAFGFGCSYFAHYEEAGVGLQWHNIHISPLLGDPYSMAKCMCMLAFDCVLYSFFTWYIETVAPGQYGVPKPYYFLFTKSYWLGQREKRNLYDPEVEREDAMEMRNPNLGPNFEKEPVHLPMGVSIQHLKKMYRNGKVAVDDLSLNFYEDQITSFLGHNGAGKTTTISILTGLFPPTNGTANIYGMDIRSDMDMIRKSLGTCPQHNVLFDHLTVEEHLWFYGCLKGRMKDKVRNEVNKMIEDIGLPHKRGELSRNLSGGMQRKLSIAIAFVGGSRTVILDEPTAGVDPYSRRAIWELLLKYKKGRTIILTTHHMDEADLLGDRIAIISHGRVRCCGSSLFLKRHFGKGYYLTLVRADPSTLAVDAQYLTRESGRALMRNEITDFLSVHIPSVKLVEDVGMELVYILPIESKEGGAFEALFDSLDQNLETLGIASYGISDSTLEEIFLKVASDDDTFGHQNGNVQPKLERGCGVRSPAIATILKLQGSRVATVPIRQSQPPFEDGIPNDDHTEMNGSVPNEGANSLLKNPSPSKHPTKYTPILGWQLIRKQIFALHVKRFHHTRRNFKGLFCEIILPAIFVCMALAFTLILPPFQMEPPLQLHPWLYGPPNFVFFSNDNPMDPMAVRYEEALVGEPGLGTRCMADEPILYKHCVHSLGLSQWTNNETSRFEMVIPCSCQIGSQVCPASAGGPSPPSIISGTTDIILNMTSRNISDWLIKTQQEYYKRRYGGFTFGLKNPLASFNITVLRNVFDRLSRAVNVGNPLLDDADHVFAEFDRGLRDLPIFSNVKVWFNNRGWAAMVSYVNALNNVLLRAHLPSDRNASLYGITAVNHPLNFTNDQVQNEVLKRSGISLLHAICVIFAMSFVPASFVLYLIDDRVAKSQHLQFVTGVKPITYWIANYIWDNMNYLIAAALCVFIFLIFNEEAYVSSTNLPGLVLLLILYGWASIPMMYPASFIFDIPSTAFVVLASGNLFIGVVSTIATFILEVMDDQELQDIADILKKVFLIFPHYCLGRGLMDMATNHLAVESLQKFGLSVERYPLSWGFLGRNLLCMFVEGIVFFSFTLLFQYKRFFYFRNTKVKTTVIEEEEDVARERALILDGQLNSSVLKIENLTKVYRVWKGKKLNCCQAGVRVTELTANELLAVDRLCIGVMPGECFGLLGVNGAGKTTTFRMLTQDTSITSGDAYVNGFSIRNQMDRARRHIGYCPQFDALDSLLTGEEHLYFYARLRGIPDKYAKEVVNCQISRLCLVDYAQKCAGTYSGGNKRKLSTAIALIGNPRLVFLDEPTTGMDPQARRFLWNCISELIKEGRSVILTSHSLEECEALCTRLAIMVNGCLQCLGSIQHLKNKFGSGYSLTIRVGGMADNLEPVKNFILETFPLAIIQEEHHNQLVFQLPSQGLALSHLFHQMEMNKSLLRVEDYSVCQTTLDQVFINFAKKQVHLLDD